MKKKTLFLMIFLVTVIFVGISIKGNNAKAKENCETHWNYYLFQDASRYGTVKGKTERGETSKAFALGVPEKGKVLDEGGVSIEKSSFKTLSGSTMSTAYFHNLTTQIMKDSSNKRSVKSPEGKTIDSWVYCNGTSCFSTAKEWAEGDAKKGAFVESPDAYSDWLNQLSGTYKIRGGNKFTSVNHSDSAPGYFFASINRYWTPAVQEELKAKNFSDDTTIFSIAAYYIKYQVCEENPEPPVTTKTNKVTTHYFIENTTTKLHDDKVEKDVPAGTYTSNCPETLKSGNKYYDRIQASVSVEMPEEGEEELICYYREQTYTMTLTYGQDEDCTKQLQEPIFQDGLKAGQAMSIDVPDAIDRMTRPTLGTYSSSIVNKPELNGTKLSFTMPAKDVSICIVYTPQTGSAMVKWLALIGLGALAFTVWNISKKNNEVNNEA